MTTDRLQAALEKARTQLHFYHVQVGSQEPTLVPKLGVEINGVQAASLAVIEAADAHRWMRLNTDPDSEDWSRLYCQWERTIRERLDAWADAVLGEQEA